MTYLYHFTRPDFLRPIALEGLRSYVTSCDTLRGDRWHYLYCFSEVVDEAEPNCDWGCPWIRFPEQARTASRIERDPVAQNSTTYRIKPVENASVVVVHPNDLSVAIARDNQQHLVFEPLPNLKNDIHKFGWKSEFLVSVEQTKAFFRKLNPDPTRRIEPFPKEPDPISNEELQQRIISGQIRLR